MLSILFGGSTATGTWTAAGGGATTSASARLLLPLGPESSILTDKLQNKELI